MENTNEEPTREPVSSMESTIEKIPKTNFEHVNIDREAEMLNHFMQDDRWSVLFGKWQPDLLRIESENKEEKVLEYKAFLQTFHLQEADRLDHALGQIRLEWEKVGNEFLITLSDHFDINWQDEKEITGYISVLPVYPRFLDNQSFFVGYKNVENIIETSAHEIIHFLWFKKWKEVFPEMDKSKYESPHLVWRLSEIIDPIILQCHPKIKELIKPKKWGYDSFVNIKIGDVSMCEYFQKIYVNSVQAGDSFDVTMKKLWKEAKLHEEEISRF